MKQADFSIDQTTFQDILSGRTGNPIADEEIPEILRAAISAGRVVLLTDLDGKVTHKLAIGEGGKFCIS